MSRWSVLLSVMLFGAAGAALVAGLSWLQGQNAVATGIPRDLTSYREVVRKVLPAVVSVESRSKPKAKSSPKSRRHSLPDDMPLPDELRKYFEDLQQSPDFENETPVHGFGSGFIIDPKGFILTNHHVVDGADQVTVQLKDGRKFVSKNIKSDRKTDLAIIRIDVKGSSLPHLELGDSDSMEIGDRVLAVGAPFGLTGSVTCGIISAKGRNGLFQGNYEDFLQTDAAINPGNSGGPLVNLEGKVIGINAAIKSRSGGFQGVGMAIASNLAKNVVDQLEKGGVVHRGYLGVAVKDLDVEVANRLGLKEGETGVLVGEIVEGSPAAKAGLKEEDIITSLGGKPVANGRELQRAVAGLPLKKPVKLSVLREGKPHDLEVTIEEQPQNFELTRLPSKRARPESSLPIESLGIKAADLTPELAEKLGFDKNIKAPVIAEVSPDSVAAEAGLERGFLIRKVDKHEVKTAAEFRAAVEKADLAKGVLLHVQSADGGKSVILLKAEKAEAK